VGTAPNPKAEGAAGEEGAVRTSGTSRILQNTVYRASADVGSKIVSFAFFLVLARQLGASAFGVFTFGLSFGALVTVLAGFGQDTTLTREVARDHRLVDRYFVNTIGLKLVVAVPVILVAVGAMTVLGADSRTLVVSTLLAVAILVETLGGTCFAVLQAYERLGFLPVVIVTQRLFTAAVGIAAIAAGAEIEAVAAIYLAGSLLAFALALSLQLRYVVRPRLTVDPAAWWFLMRNAIPVGIALFTQLTLFRVDIVILQALDSEEAVGNYGAAYRLFEATLFLSWAVAAAVYPVLARYAEDTAMVRSVFERAIKLVIALTLPVALVGGLLAGPIVRLFYGAEFERAVPALELLAAAIVLCSVSHVTATLLLAEHRERVIAIVYGIVAVANIVGNLVFIPIYSLNAAALITTLSEATLCALMLAYLYRERIALNWRRVLTGPLAAGVPAAAVLVALRDHPLVAGAAALALFAVLLASAEQAFYPEDAGRIWRMARGVRHAVLGRPA
jgi:O-antigen/teichoic acid export membrane protein